MKIKGFAYVAFAAALFSAALSFSGCKKVEDNTVTETVSLTSITPMTTISVPETVSVPEIITTTAPETTVSETEKAARVITPKMEWQDLNWDKDFMENTLFVGDSVCRALYVYNDLLTTKQVAAVGGGAARNIYDYTFKMENNEFDLKQAVDYYKPAAVFLWMGINDINMTDKEVYSENLKNIAEDVLAHSPESRVVILSMSPTADYHEWNANERIREYNQAAREMCEKIENEEIYYLDIQDILSDTDGYLLPECDSGDGMHLSQMAYIRLLSYITAAKDEFMPSIEETAVTSDTSVSEEQENIESVSEETSETAAQ
ncbi:MAG: SGNH/GDSL hydrolase family protein [Oscillospiraceae bacterium]